MIYLKNFISGYLVGALSLIPGISGGTALVLLNQFDKFIYELTNIFNKNVKTNKNFIIFIILGIILGSITFANVTELLFTFIPIQTLFMFSGFVLFNIPKFYKKEFKDSKINIIFFIIGLFIIAILSNFVPENPTYIIKNFPQISLIFLFIFTLFGMLDGILTIFPGISGSMVMMIIGPYFLYKSYLANLNENIIYILPLCCYFIGDLIGIFIGSKISYTLLKKYRNKTMSFIYGMIVMSSLILIPTNVTYTPTLLISSFIFLIISFFITKILE